MKIFVLTSPSGEKSGWGRYASGVIEAFHKAGIPVVRAVPLPPPLHYANNYLFAPWHAWRLRRVARTCEVIHSFIEPYSAIARWLSLFTGKRYFVTIHGTYGILPYRQSGWMRFIHHWSLTGAARIFCVSRYTKSVLARYGLRNLVVIANGIALEKFPSSSPRPFAERRNLVLTVGALKRRKGQHVSLQAFARVAGRVPRVRYCLVGDQSDTAYFQRLRKLVVSLGVEEKVEFRASISDKELISFYQEAKVFVLTPLSETPYFEGFGLVYLEANAHGVPVIGSKDSGAEDAIVDGQTGFLVAQDDISGVAQKMEILLSNGDLWQRMSTRAIQWTRQHDWRETAREYARIYQSS